MQRSWYGSAVKFFRRYPIFLLAFGPPIFRSQGIDATSGVIDYWTIVQVGCLSLIAFRAITRLISAQTILIPRQIRSILRLSFFLGLLFLVSSAYSPSPAVSAAYSVLYVLTLICVAEFIVDAYREPPDWIDSLFQLRLAALSLLVLCTLIIPFHAFGVFESTPEAGIRFVGGALASVQLISAIIAIISAYSFLFRLEARRRAFSLFLIGLGGELSSKSRFGEAALFLCLLLTVIYWARISKRIASAAISASIAFASLALVVNGLAGRGRIWTIVNKGQSVASIRSASGRTEMWAFLFKYCLSHPQGMGYVAGFRIVFRQYFSLTSGQSLSQLGTAHNTFLDVLAGAGWLALGIYLIMIVKMLMLAWRFAGRQRCSSSVLDQSTIHGLRCSMLLLIFCLSYGMGATEFSAPLRGSFYILYIIIAMILGASATLIAASRARSPILSL